MKTLSAIEARIVDGFYIDPMAVRATAVACTWVDAWGSWSGLHSLERTADTREQLFRMSALVSDLRPNWEELDASYQFWKKASCGGFASMFENQAGVIHAHRRSGDWAGVVYLSLPAQCEGRPGTIFYRHRTTGIDYLADVDSDAARAALADARNPDAWEITEIVPMQFNRLLVFNSRFFHGASQGFGDKLENCRLIQVFNFSFPGESS